VGEEKLRRNLLNCAAMFLGANLLRQTCAAKGKIHTKICAASYLLTRFDLMDLRRKSTYCAATFEF